MVRNYCEGPKLAVSAGKLFAVFSFACMILVPFPADGDMWRSECTSDIELGEPLGPNLLAIAVPARA